MSNNVKVLLQTTVPNLGGGGEVVRVRSGYARNYLLPRGLALPASEGNLKRVDELKRAASSLAKKELDSANELAAKLTALGSVVIERAFGEEGKMYGSVTSKDIEEAYESRGVAIDRRKIQLSDPIKQLGSYPISLKLHSEVIATLTVEVKKKG